MLHCVFITALHCAVFLLYPICITGYEMKVVSTYFVNVRETDTEKARAFIAFSMKQEIHSVELGVCPMQLFHFWSRDVHAVQNMRLCTKLQTRWFFTEIWQYIDFQNGGRPPSWNCFTTIQDHPRSLCCWPQPVKIHVWHRTEESTFCW